MSLKIKFGGKGKKRVLDTPTPTLVGDNEPPHPTKRPKRAETRQCPICDERIPLRLLEKHADLESERVDDIMSNIGSGDVNDQYFNEWASGEPGPSTRRLSALKARKSLSSSSSPIALIPHSIAFASQTIQQIKRHRKIRHARLKELLRADIEGEGDASGSPSWVGRFTGEEIDCPVCGLKVRGDEDVVNAHVDACLAYEGRRALEALEIEREREAEASYQAEDEDVEDTGTYVGDLRGAGFHTRDAQHADVDHEIDIEGDDLAVFGEAQFTEGDVVPVNQGTGQQHDSADEDADVNIEDDEGDDAQQTLRGLVAAGKKKQQQQATSLASDLTNDRMTLEEADVLDVAIAIARQRNDNVGLIAALQNKVKHLESCESGIDSASPLQPLLCRICLDPYDDPTVSTGCWHTCCKECWLRCLGSTKLCPICKRITCATDLRRIYL
ncbi:hypothetical protein CPB83DRAFT_855178 [Crepidotus variabilis]|uniref:RING-type domain-containing protein n=1 Tax=Crepidotus variabilis TaxID=179855 RepID=A0A9P6EEG5_9AGAR|nr:hypothetical protein CPB83DRAFT_855178 [Crepidotus variabilis]